MSEIMSKEEAKDNLIEYVMEILLLTMDDTKSRKFVDIDDFESYIGEEITEESYQIHPNDIIIVRLNNKKNTQFWILNLFHHVGNLAEYGGFWWINKDNLNKSGGLQHKIPSLPTPSPTRTVAGSAWDVIQSAFNHQPRLYFLMKRPEELFPHSRTLNYSKSGFIKE